MEQQSQQSVEAELGGQKFKFTGNNLNHIFTVMGFVMLCLIGWELSKHGTDTRDAAAAGVIVSKEQIMAVRELTSAVKEQNCIAVLRDLPANLREQMLRDPTFCKNLTR